MHKIRFTAFIIFFLASCAAAFGQGYRSIVFKTVGELSVRMVAKDPVELKERNPAILFFHGGGWSAGDPMSLIDFFSYFSEHGYVTFTVGYRLVGSTSKTIDDQVEDAMDAINYVYQNAETLKIDTDSVFLCGYSAGGHLALSSVMMEQKNKLVHIPKRLALLSTPVDPQIPLKFCSFGALIKDVWHYSPYHKIVSGLPPMLFFHGTKDKIVPYASVVAFVKKMKAKQNDCKLISLEGGDHFFIEDSNDLKTVLEAMDAFFSGTE
jgi:acetyl esterase/lipase